jgi:hypothetical protein
MSSPPAAPPFWTQPARAWWLWIVGGAVYGIALRALLGALPTRWDGVMSVAFLLGTPFVVGVLTVYGRSLARMPSWLEATFLPWLTILLMLAGCAATMLEGAICLAIIAPLFLSIGSMGGLIMRGVLEHRSRPPTGLPAIAILPLLMLLGEGQLPRPEHVIELRRSVDVAASPQTVWNQILVARAIRADELPASLVHGIGVPRPLEGVNVATADGEVRFSRWERGIAFQARVLERREAEYIRWQYAFGEHAFPPGSMDDHVAIGGRYFDLRDTAFHLQPLPGGRTRLEIVAHYRLTTPVNAYAVPVSRVLGQDFLATILGLYQGRSERAEAAPGRRR